jgi:hypothetical protein
MVIIYIQREEVFRKLIEKTHGREEHLDGCNGVRSW